MLVLWGARAGDVQAGSREDRRRQAGLDAVFHLHAQMARTMKRVLASLPTAAEFAANMQRLGATGMPTSEAVANMRANLERMKASERE